MLFYFLFSFASFAQQLQVPTGRIEGVTLERGTKRPLSDVNVFILPHKLKATSDAKGRFIFESVPMGEYEFVVNLANYKKFSSKENLDLANQGPNKKILLERANYQVFEITVRDKANKRDDTTRSLKAEQFLNVPGANGDPVKAVQNLPGVARVQGFSSQVIIQGSAPQDTSYLIDDHEVPLIFHFGGLTSVITPEAVEQVDYLSAGYGPEYGRAMGGLIGLKTRNPATDRTKGFAFVDITKSGGMIEGPIDESSSYLVTARYSYLGFVLGQVLKDEPAFNLTVAPSFGDLAAIYKKKFSNGDEFKLLTLASRDELKFVLNEPLREDPGLRGEFSNNTDFYRLIPQWERRLSAGEAWRASLGFGQDKFKVNAGDNFLDVENLVLTQRTEWEKKFRPDWTSFLGVDTRLGRAEVAFKLPSISDEGGVNDPFSSGETVERSVTQNDVLIGPFWRNRIKAEDSRWTLMPSVRLDYFNRTEEVLPQPRFAARFDQNSSLFYKAAAGLYFQPPEPQETSPGFGNPDLHSPRAWHFTTGFEKDFRGGSTNGFTLQTNLFYRRFEKLVVKSESTVIRNGVVEFERFSNEGTGRAYGAEFLVRFEKRPWSGWLSYTLSRSHREEPGQREYLFEFDQTHNVNIVGAYEANNNWRFSSRLRYVTGNPVTPVVGSTFDADNDVYLPKRGPFFSERNSPFVQLDLRIDKTWVYDTWLLNVYLDIQNATNQKNSEGIRYSYNYAEKRDIASFPVLPTFGIRGDF
jgi:hypothetical protein